MTATGRSTTGWTADYPARLAAILGSTDWTPVAVLGDALLTCWRSGHQVFICGNGGSAANAVHLANDLLYGVAKECGPGLRVHALSANTAVISCLANDCGYDQIFSRQLAVLANPDDILIVLSGSGNSPNILAVLDTARTLGVRSFAILGYAGGKARDMADVAMHFPVNDMQIAEDLQLVVGHMTMQFLYAHRPGGNSPGAPAE